MGMHQMFIEVLWCLETTAGSRDLPKWREQHPPSAPISSSSQLSPPFFHSKCTTDSSAQRTQLTGMSAIGRRMLGTWRGESSRRIAFFKRVTRSEENKCPLRIFRNITTRSSSSWGRRWPTASASLTSTNWSTNNARWQIELINKKHTDSIKFCTSKADTGWFQRSVASTQHS